MMKNEITTEHLIAPDGPNGPRSALQRCLLHFFVSGHLSPNGESICWDASGEPGYWRMNDCASADPGDLLSCIEENEIVKAEHKGDLDLDAVMDVMDSFLDEQVEIWEVSMYGNISREETEPLYFIEFPPRHICLELALEAGVITQAEFDLAKAIAAESEQQH